MLPNLKAFEKVSLWMKMKVCASDTNACLAFVLALMGRCHVAIVQHIYIHIKLYILLNTYASINCQMYWYTYIYSYSHIKSLYIHMYIQLSNIYSMSGNSILLFLLFCFFFFFSAKWQSVLFHFFPRLIVNQNWWEQK